MNFRLRCLMGGYLIMAWLFVAIAPVHADYTIDQENSNGFLGNSNPGQTFTTQDYGRINRIDVYVDANNTCDAAELCVYEGDRIPNDPSAALYCQDISGLNDYSWAFWHTTNLQAGQLLVDSNTQYTFGLIQTGINCSLRLGANSNASYDYLGGQKWPLGGPFLDLAFRVYIEEIEWADLVITKTDNQNHALPGGPVTYTITVTNNGPADVTGANVSDTFPAALTGVSFTASQTGGATGFTASGSGNINDTVNMPTGSQIIYTVQATIDSAAIGTLSNTATVSADGLIEPDNNNNTATDDTQLPADFGDAPASYGTLLADDGPRHAVTTTGQIRLGLMVDDETDAQLPLDGTGDNVNGSDDEDGVVFPDDLVWGDGSVELTVNGGSLGGQLDAWMDFDGNGSFDHPDEHLWAGASQNLAPGDNDIVFAIPEDAVVGLTYARFRLSSNGGLTPTGSVADGEVEDYPVEIKNVQIPTLNSWGIVSIFVLIALTGLRAMRRRNRSAQ